MIAILINYNFTPDWLRDYPNMDYIIYDRSDTKEYLKDFDQSKIIYTENIGNVDYDRLGYLVENYDNLPDVFLWSKSNLFKYITKEEFDKVKDNKHFTPLLTMNHRTYSDEKGVVCYYDKGIYWERNDSWFLNEHTPKYIETFNDWARIHLLPNVPYTPFAPGGNYILTRETIHKYAVDFYENMRDMLPHTQLPGEAQCCERSYYMMWK